MSYYIGFLKKDARYAMVFKSIVKPKAQDYTYFVKVIGPYPEEWEAKKTLRDLKHVGWRENPIKGLVTKDGIRKAIALSKKITKLYGVVRRKNPEVGEHQQKFLFYMQELEKYVVGSVPYIRVLARAYAHLQSVKDLR
jgi:hypothetical protein